MTKEEIFNRISHIIKEQMHQEQMTVTVSTSLQDDLGVDSISLMEFVVNLEDEFNIEIPDEDVEDMTNMGEMMDYLYHRIN